MAIGYNYEHKIHTVRRIQVNIVKQILLAITEGLAKMIAATQGSKIVNTRRQGYLRVDTRRAFTFDIQAALKTKAISTSIVDLYAERGYGTTKATVHCAAMKSANVGRITDGRTGVVFQIEFNRESQKEIADILLFNLPVEFMTEV